VTGGSLPSAALLALRRAKLRLLPEPSLIVVTTRGGLGNKLKALVSALRLTEEVATTDGTFGVLLENDIPVLEEVPPHAREFSDWRFVLTPFDRLPHDFASVPIPERGDAEPRIPVGRSIDFEYERVPPPLREAFLAAFARLAVRAPILAAVERVTADWPRGTVGVHVRSWAGSEFRRRTLFDLDRFFHAVDRRASAPLFVCGDAPEVLEAFRRRYDRRILPAAGGDETVGHSGHTEDERVLARALTDMLCLARADALVGTHLSTFTECAWWLGGCRQRLEIV
jgi:hypothetical protein